MKKIVLPSLLLMSVLFISTPANALIVGGCGATCYPTAETTDTALTLENIIGFLWRQALIIITFYISGYACGNYVEKGKLSPSISRKIVCITTFAMSFTNSILAAQSTQFIQGPIFILASLFFLWILLATLSRPAREKSQKLRIVFTSINRPEDEPNTLLWLSTEAAATSLIILTFTYFATTQSFYDLAIPPETLSFLLLIPILASGIGDALAEIVGKKWGRLHYKTHALFTKQKYTRTIEGSSAVFLTTLIVGLTLAFLLPTAIPLYFWKAVILLPVSMTLSEALAPHTWDNPILYLTGYLTITLCIMI